jgi:hypothetical protein
MRKRLPSDPDMVPDEEETPEETVLSFTNQKNSKETVKLQEWLESQIKIAYRKTDTNMLVIYVHVPSEIDKTINVPKEGTQEEFITWELKKFSDTDKIIYKCPILVKSIEDSKDLVGSFIVIYQTKYILMALKKPANDLIH